MEILHSTLQLYLQLDTLGNNDKKNGINFSFVVRGVKGGGQAYAHPPLPLSAALIAQELPTGISLKSLRLKWKSAKNRVSSTHGMILDSHDLMDGTGRDRQV